MRLDSTLQKAVLSSAKSGPYKKVTFRKIENDKYQISLFDGKQETHKNILTSSLNEEFHLFLKDFKQAHLYTDSEWFHIQISKSGKETITKKKMEIKAPSTHNREKRHILKEGQPYLFLEKLDIQNANGSIKEKRRDKFSQINQFLHLIEPLLSHLPKNPHIVDFGCGKGYLTLALNHFLNDTLHLNAHITGLDLKKEVIDSLNTLRFPVTFLHGDIATYKPSTQPDMVIALHACDTATDLALYQAITWGAKVILAAPCCQQEGLPHIQSQTLKPLLRHGVIKERLNALATDALRAELLESQGYKTDIIEFIDSAHTPKNLAIKALYTGHKKPLTSYQTLKDELHFEPHLAHLLLKKA